MGSKMETKQIKVTVKADEAVLKGVYSNNLMIARTGEEFILDFINLVPPQAFVTSRIIVSPMHMKRIVKAMSESLSKYEEMHGEIKDVPPQITPEALKQ